MIWKDLTPFTRTAHANRATDAKYTIRHANGSDTITVNQQQSGGQWNLLGSYNLNTSSTIVLSSNANGYVIADGIKLVTTSTGAPSGIYYVHNDHLGTPQTLTDDNQDVVWNAEYDPFGKATVTTETVTNNIRFPGQYFDQETGLHYNYFRTYDPRIGRYVTSDPIGLDGGESTYGYALQSPVNFYDPDGKAAVSSIPLLPSIPSASEVAAAVATACTKNPIACAIGVSGAAGYGAGSIFYPYIAEPLGDAIDKVCRDDPTAEECEAEWERAYQICEREISSGIEHGRNRGITGGYTNLYDCARGLVSQKCGGNKVE